MKIKWWGHSSFLITSSDEIKVLTDPYNEELPYNKITDSPDYITVSHDHFDHNAVDLISGRHVMVKTTDGIKNEQITIKGISSFHDENKGEQRGENIIYVIEFDQFKVCHLGDLGHKLTNDQIKQLKDIDILLIPVGGNYTIDANQAYKIVNELNPLIVMPMHYKTEILNFPISGVDKFIKLFKNNRVEVINNSEIEIDQKPKEQKVYVLDYVK